MIRPPRPAPPLALLLVLGLCLLLGSGAGCAKKQYLPNYLTGELDAAAAELAKLTAKSANGPSAVHYLLEYGAVLRAAGRLEESNQAFEDAYGRMTFWDNQPDTKIVREGLALVTNLNSLPYRGSTYDAVMATTYKALNHLELGDIDSARIELNRADKWQAEAVRRNEKQIAAAEAQIADSKYDVAAARRDGRVQSQFDQKYAFMDKYAAYGNFTNPFLEVLSGIFFTATAQDPGDIERGRKSFERALGMVGQHPDLQADLAMAEALSRGAPFPPVTWVIFETGTAPIREEIRIDLPTIIVSEEVPYFGASFPQLAYNELYIPSLIIQRPGGGEHPTYLVCDMDAVVTTEFKKDLPAIITKTLIASGTKAALSAVAIQVAGDNPYARLFTQLSTAILQAAFNNADLRTWTTLPKQIGYARIPLTSADRTLVLQARGRPPVTITVDEGVANVVFVKSISPSLPLIVTQFRLR